MSPMNEANPAAAPSTSSPSSPLRSYCPLDCPDSCSLEVHIEDGRVARLEGDHRNPVTAGFICTKVRHFPEHMYGEHRLAYPEIRVGAKGEGRFRRARWEEALSLITRRIREVREAHGAEAILPLAYGGSNGLLTDGTTDARFFHRLGASRLARTVCAAATSKALVGVYGKMAGISPEDYPEAKLIVIWGANPSASQIHLVPRVLAAQSRGAKLVVVDPRATPLAKKADLHIALRPGTDLPVALSLHRALFEEGGADTDFLAAHTTGAESLRARAREWTFERAAEAAGVEAADLARFADRYREASPALMRCGWGPERNRNGGSAIAAILALPAVAGKFGVRGGGVSLTTSGAWNLDVSRAVAAPPPDTRTVNMNRTGRVLLGEEGPPVHLLFVYNANPLATLPDQERMRRGLARDDLFTVVFDAVRTDTALWADVLLPATTFLEHGEMSRSYGAMVLQRAEPLVRPFGEARPNFDVFLDLTRRLELDRPGDVEDEEGFARAALEADGTTPEQLRNLAADGLTLARPDGRPVQFVDVFPGTSDRKVHLFPEELDRETPAGLYAFQPDPATAAFPLALISPATHKTISSTLGQLMRGDAALALHPDDAAARGLRSGERVRVHNDLGEVHCRLEVTDEVRPGVGFLPKGLWSRHTANGATSNALSPDSLTDFAGGACFNDARVEVERLAEPSESRDAPGSGLRNGGAGR